MTKAFRDRLSRLLGRKPAQMQVAALCLDAATGRVLLVWDAPNLDMGLGSILGAINYHDYYMRDVFHSKLASLLVFFRSPSALASGF